MAKDNNSYKLITPPGDTIFTYNLDEDTYGIQYYEGTSGLPAVVENGLNKIEFLDFAEAIEHKFLNIDKNSDSLKWFAGWYIKSIDSKYK